MGRERNHVEGRMLMLTGSRRLIVLVVLQVVAGALGAGAGEPLVEMLEARVPELMAVEHVPGLSMVLIRENRIVWEGAFGVRAAGEPERVDSETVFEAASMSKPLFTYAVLRLVEEGRFDLDRPLDSYLPEPYDEP